MKNSVYTIVVVLCILLNGCKHNYYYGALKRPSDFSAALKPVEHTRHNKDGKPYSLCFIEFDSCGNFLDAKQKHLALKEIRDAKSKQKTVVVSYVHGWRHGTNSGDVLAFKELLGHFANSLKYKNINVVGVYLSWPGAAFDAIEPIYNSEDTITQKASFPLSLSEVVFTAYNRYSIAAKVGESEIFRSTWSDITRAVHTLDGNTGKHIMVGHSMGGLILELSVVSEYVKQKGKSNAIPDLTFLMNSAAPVGVSRKHFFNPANDDLPYVNTPKFVTLTSYGDWATGLLAPTCISLGCFTSPFMRNLVHEDLTNFVPYSGRSSLSFGEKIIQSSQYDSTIGHALWLQNSTFKFSKKQGGIDPDDNYLIHMNLFPDDEKENGEWLESHLELDQFAFMPKKTMIDPNDLSKKCYIVLSKKPLRNNYLNGAYEITGINSDLISDHGDIWGTQSISLFCFFVRKSLHLADSPLAH